MCTEGNKEEIHTDVSDGHEAACVEATLTDMIDRINRTTRVVWIVVDDGTSLVINLSAACEMKRNFLALFKLYTNTLHTHT